MMVPAGISFDTHCSFFVGGSTCLLGSTAGNTTLTLIVLCSVNWNPTHTNHKSQFGTMVKHSEHVLHTNLACQHSVVAKKVHGKCMDRSVSRGHQDVAYFDPCTHCYLITLYKAFAVSSAHADKLEHDPS